MSPNDRRTFNPVDVSIAGFHFAQLALGVLGVLVISGEYSTGMIRSSFAAVPKRLPVLWAKLLMFGTVGALADARRRRCSRSSSPRRSCGSTTCRPTFGSPHVARAVIGSRCSSPSLGCWASHRRARAQHRGRHRHPGRRALRAARDRGDPAQQLGRHDQPVPAEQRGQAITAIHSDPAHALRLDGFALFCAYAAVATIAARGAARATRRLTRPRMGAVARARTASGGDDQARAVIDWLQRFGRYDPLTDTAIVGRRRADRRSQPAPPPAVGHRADGGAVPAAVAAAPLPASGVRGDHAGRVRAVADRRPAGRGSGAAGLALHRRRSRRARWTAAAVGVAEVGAVLAIAALGRPGAPVLRRPLGAGDRVGRCSASTSRTAGRCWHRCTNGPRGSSSSATSRAGSPPPPSAPGSRGRCTTSSPTTCRW